MKTSSNNDNKRNEDISAKQNEAGNISAPNFGSSVNEGQQRSEKDPQNTSMGLGSQPASVNLNRGEGEQEKTNRSSDNDKSKRDDENNSAGYGASNNVAGA